MAASSLASLPRSQSGPTQKNKEDKSALSQNKDGSLRKNSPRKLGRAVGMGVAGSLLRERKVQVKVPGPEAPGRNSSY